MSNSYETPSERSVVWTLLDMLVEMHIVLVERHIQMVLLLKAAVPELQALERQGRVQIPQGDCAILGNLR
jgi:hypothetical protein